MRILVDIRHLNEKKQSGVGEYTTQLLRALFALKSDHEFILFSAGTVRPDLKALGIDPAAHKNVSHTHRSTPSKLLNTRAALLKHPSLNWYVKSPVDLIWLPNLAITTLPQDIPVVLTIHDLSWKHFPEFFSKKMQLWHNATNPKHLIKTSANIITPSTSTKRDVERVFSKAPEQTHAIPHGISEEFQPKMEARDHGVRSRLKLPKRFALFVGTIEPRKNLLTLIDAMKRYREESRDDLHLVIAGKWGWRSHDVRRRLWRTDARNWVHQIGYVPSEDRAALYRSATLLTWPSFYEGFGLPVLEAMACGTPVITTSTSSLPELTKGAAIHIDPYNTQDIVSALRGLAKSQPLQHQLTKEGRNVAQEYTWKQTAQKTLEIFEKSI